MPSYVFKIKSIYNITPFFKCDGLPIKEKKNCGLFSVARVYSLEYYTNHFIS